MDEKRCNYEECKNNAYYNYSGEITPSLCNEHKFDGMILTNYEIFLNLVETNDNENVEYFLANYDFFLHNRGNFTIEEQKKLCQCIMRILGNISNEKKCRQIHREWRKFIQSQLCIKMTVLPTDISEEEYCQICMDNYVFCRNGDNIVFTCGKCNRVIFHRDCMLIYVGKNIGKFMCMTCKN